MPPIRNVPAGIYTCGIPSIGETRSFAASSTVGEASEVGATVAVGGLAVTDGITVGGIVGRRVDSTTGICVCAQAERRKMNKKIEKSFFTKIIICHCEEGVARRSNLLLYG